MHKYLYDPPPTSPRSSLSLKQSDSSSCILSEQAATNQSREICAGMRVYFSLADTLLGLLRLRLAMSKTTLTMGFLKSHAIQDGLTPSILSK